MKKYQKYQCDNKDCPINAVEYIYDSVISDDKKNCPHCKKEMLRLY